MHHGEPVRIDTKNTSLVDFEDEDDDESEE